jgi:hypothetical protein
LVRESANCPSRNEIMCSQTQQIKADHITMRGSFYGTLRSAGYG